MPKDKARLERAEAGFGQPGLGAVHPDIRQVLLLREQRREGKFGDGNTVAATPAGNMRHIEHPGWKFIHPGGDGVQPAQFPRPARRFLRRHHHVAAPRRHGEENFRALRYFPGRSGR